MTLSARASTTGSEPTAAQTVAGTPASVPAIRTEALRKVFGHFSAVHGVDLQVMKGENFALLGPNGAGKSTLIRMLTTLMVPSSGRAEVAGIDVERDADAVRGKIGVVPQAMTSDPDLTARENLDFYALLYGVSRSRRRVMANDLLAAVDLLDWSNKLVGTFSGGMRRRLEIARSLMHQPEVLFLDEPTTGLDPASRLAMWEMLRRLKAQTGLTILLTTHYMEEAEDLCDRVAIMDHGQVVALGTPAELQTALDSPRTIDVCFDGAPPDWPSRLAALPGVTDLVNDRGTWSLLSDDRMATSAALLALAARFGVSIPSLVARGHTLEDVFIGYTGRDLRDRVGKRQVDVSHLYEQQPGR